MSHADDLAYVRQITEEGASAPSLSGRFTIWWGVLVTIALLLHWSVLQGFGLIQTEYIGAIWMTMGIVGGIGSGIMSRSMRGKPGSSTAGNRAQNAVWPVITVAIFIYAIGLAFAVAQRGQPVVLFDTIIPLAFTLYAVTFAMSGVLFRDKMMSVKVIATLVLIGACVYLIGSPTLYLVAAAGVIVTQIIPGFAQLRAEPKSIV